MSLHDLNTTRSPRPNLSSHKLKLGPEEAADRDPASSACACCLILWSLSAVMLLEPPPGGILVIVLELVAMGLEAEAADRDRVRQGEKIVTTWELRRTLRHSM